MSCSVSGSTRRPGRRRPPPSRSRPPCAARRRSRRPACRCTRRRMPAVSTNVQVSRRSSISSSTGSRVVPATSSTTTRSEPATLFSREDLPTFGRPTSATRRGPRAAPSRARTRRAAPRAASSRSPVPRPCSAETGCGSPRPRAHRQVASASPRGAVHLVGAQHDGLAGPAQQLDDAPRRWRWRPRRRRPRRSRRRQRRSRTRPARRPWRRCRATSCSQPPVSTSMNRRPSHSAW